MPKRIIDAGVSKIMKYINILQSNIKISTDKEKYFAGEIIHAEIELKLGAQINARALEINLNCIQTKRIKSMREMDQYDYRLDKEIGIPRSTHLRTIISEKTETIYSEIKKIIANGKFSSEKFNIEFEIPWGAKSTKKNFDYDETKRFWRIDAKLDIPQAMDISASKKIEII
ncbi:MAG: hypothetical protein WC501_00270 [Candidatus Micrarchaeia archaeon]